MSKTTNKKQPKKAKKLDRKKLKTEGTKLLRGFALIVLIAGVAVFDLPELTASEVLGSISLLTLVAAITQWVR